MIAFSFHWCPRCEERFEKDPLRGDRDRKLSRGRRRRYVDIQSDGVHDFHDMSALIAVLSQLLFPSPAECNLGGGLKFLQTSTN